MVTEEQKDRLFFATGYRCTTLLEELSWMFFDIFF